MFEAPVMPPWVNTTRINVIPMPKNPMDKTTIISIWPRAIHEEKITLFPGSFDIPAGSMEKPSSLVVGASSWWKEVWESNQLLEIPQHSYMVAKSIIDDWVKGLHGYVGGQAQPGLFCLPGEVSVKEVKEKHKELLDRAETWQRAYYLNLVNIADVLWPTSNNNPIAISDIMRLAAQELKLDTKEWLKNFQSIELRQCVACGSPRNPAFPICPNCKTVVDVAKAKELGLKFVE